MKPRKPDLSVPKAEPSYDVGYGKPPETTRFKSGLSGNPRGRPKGSKNKQSGSGGERLANLIREEAYRHIPIKEDGRHVTMPLAKAVYRSLGVGAAKGQLRSQKLFMELLKETEAEELRHEEEWWSTIIGYKHYWEGELARRERSGITYLPDPLPHPDHVVIDPWNGVVTYTGPLTKEEKKEWDGHRELKLTVEKRLRELHDNLEAEEDPERRKEIEYSIGRVQNALRKVTAVIG